MNTTFDVNCHLRAGNGHIRAIRERVGDTAASDSICPNGLDVFNSKVSDAHICKRVQHGGAHRSQTIVRGRDVVGGDVVPGRGKRMGGADLLELIHRSGDSEGAVGGDGAEIAGHHTPSRAAEPA